MSAAGGKYATPTLSPSNDSKKPLPDRTQRASAVKPIPVVTEKAIKKVQLKKLDS